MKNDNFQEILHNNNMKMTTPSNLIAPPPFYHDLHINYIQTLASKIDSPSSYEGAVTEHLRMSGVYWSLTALSLLVPFEEVDKRMNLTGEYATKEEEQQVHSTSDNNDHSTINSNAKSTSGVTSKKQSIVDWVFSCYDTSSGGFGGNLNQDGHILYTLSALQILALADKLSDPRLLSNKEQIVHFITSCQQADGSFAGDEWGEVDTRFTYCALSSLSLLDELSAVDVDKAAEYIASCQNFDGGFGCTQGAESHAGQIFTCVGALSIARRLDLIHDVELLCWWLAERQCDSGGLNGRPEKQADVCYSWWILSSLCILGRVDYIKGSKLASFILKCQDDEDGGIADRPSDMPDVFHTFFGISGLSLIGILHGMKDGSDDFVFQISGDEGSCSRKYRMIDPIYALPTDVVQKLKLKGQVMTRSTEESVKQSEANGRLEQYDTL